VLRRGLQAPGCLVGGADEVQQLRMRPASCGASSMARPDRTRPLSASSSHSMAAAAATRCSSRRRAALSAAASATRTDWYALTAVLDHQRGQAAIVCFSIRAANRSGRGCTAVDIISTKKKEEGAFRFPGACLIRSDCS
jgi:hypothetical protein